MSVFRVVNATVVRVIRSRSISDRSRFIVIATIWLACWCMSQSSFVGVPAVVAQTPADSADSGDSGDSGDLSDAVESGDATESAIELDDVLDWIDELEAPEAAVRNQAEAKLIEAGAPVLQYLPEPYPGMPIEVRGRLERVRRTIRDTRAIRATGVDATQIRLASVKNLSQALEAISRDSGVEFQHSHDPFAPVKGSETPLPFWHALDLVLDQVGLDVNFYGGDRTTLALVPRTASRPSRVDSAAYAGIYRLEPVLVSSTRSLRSEDQSSMNLTIEASWQPGRTPIGLTLPTSELRGRLDDGGRLRPQPTADTIEVATTADIAQTEFFLPMQLPAGTPQQIQSLSGIVRALIPGDSKTFELSLTEPNASVQQDAMSVSIDQVRPNGALVELRVAIDLRDAQDSLESHRQWIFENEAFVRDDEGNRVDHLGYEVFRQTKSGVGIGYLFDIGDDWNGMNFVYKSPTSVSPNEVSFVLQDIALP